MLDILIPTLFVAGLGLVCAVLLVLAAKFMSVKEDDRIPKVRECLPGANCGACGYTGCDGYAKALVEDESVKCNLCVPGGDATAQKLADMLGKEAEDVVEMVAFVSCNGNCKATHQRFEYIGVETCKAANMYYSGSNSCSYGCIGLGDCAKVCPQDAICLEAGIAVVKSELCIGCGLCAKTCPHDIISLVPDVEKTIVVCSSHDKGALTRKICTNGCIGCGKCQKTCQHDAIKVVDNLATIDYDKCVSCGECIGVCPVGCIHTKSLLGAHKV